MAALQRAVALAEVDGVAVLVGQHLELDVARVAEVFFEVHGVVAEGRLGLAAGERNGVQQRRLGVHHAHALAAAAGGGLISTG